MIIWIEFSYITSLLCLSSLKMFLFFLKAFLIALKQLQHCDSYTGDKWMWKIIFFLYSWRNWSDNYLNWVLWCNFSIDIPPLKPFISTFNHVSLCYSDEIQTPVCKLTWKIIFILCSCCNGKETTVNSVLDGSTYPG
jgi:hypothetical protein